MFLTSLFGRCSSRLGFGFDGRVGPGGVGGPGSAGGPGAAGEPGGVGGLGAATGRGAGGFRAEPRSAECTGGSDGRLDDRRDGVGVDDDDGSNDEPYSQPCKIVVSFRRLALKQIIKPSDRSKKPKKAPKKIPPTWPGERPPFGADRSLCVSPCSPAGVGSDTDVVSMNASQAHSDTCGKAVVVGAIRGPVAASCS